MHPLGTGFPPIVVAFGQRFTNDDFELLAMIPYSTDAPIYHLPIGTVAIIVLNIVLHAALPDSVRSPDVELYYQGEPMDQEQLLQILQTPPSEDEESAPNFDESAIEVRQTSNAPVLALEYGTIKPWQWLTSVYLHAGYGHLIGNMIFLWAFGLVVEGKVGLLAFLLIYHVIGAGQSALEQSIMIASDTGSSLGASAAIFGLLGVTMMWAPRNEFECFWSYGTIDVPILAFAGLKFAFEGISFFISGMAVSSSFLHLMGAVFGVAVGALWIKKNWVDCEGFDLFCVLSGNEGRRQERDELDRQAEALVNSATAKRLKKSAPAKVTPAKTPPAKVMQAVTVPPAFTPPQPIQHASFPQQPELSLPNSVSDNWDMNSSNAEMDFNDIFSSGLHLPGQNTAERKLALQQALLEKRFADVGELLRKVHEADASFQLSQAELQGWIEFEMKQSHYSTAVPLIQQHIQRFEIKRVPMQVQLAKILLKYQKNEQALRILKSINQAGLPPTACETIEKLTVQATSAQPNK